jgi:hypothetical protein
MLDQQRELARKREQERRRREAVSVVQKSIWGPSKGVLESAEGRTDSEPRPAALHPAGL